jgi:ABC-2 type transport system ATP-binding protein
MAGVLPRLHGRDGVLMCLNSPPGGRKFRVKELKLHLQATIEAIPDSLAAYSLELSEDGRAVTYDYDTKGERTGITSLLSDLRTAGIRISDLDTRQSSLEGIFVSLVRAP